MFHQPEIRWLGGYSPHKPPLGVRSLQVAMIHPKERFCPCSRCETEAEVRFFGDGWLLLRSWYTMFLVEETAGKPKPFCGYGP